ncbi:hypothetical protein GCK72_025205 [Caenorhabditis remanei]|uniref:Uncharacterized protein n=1 Tax=Caenorhabditis remanei TaxID=31234 RepID=A0A6A5G1C4_CAERE|nr:hypothetical protein GCK72_025205 [Caenorhabditis remanei]KAF1748738.1 hypothetical protein GCK72_025205 [Caenorhabditis remanei]
MVLPVHASKLPIRTLEDFSIEEYNNIQPDYFHKLDNEDTATQLMIIKEIGKQLHRSSDQNEMYRMVGVEICKMTGKLLKIDDIDSLYKVATSCLFKLIHRAVVEKSILPANMEGYLEQWELYPAIRFMRDKTRAYENTLRRSIEKSASVSSPVVGSSRVPELFSSQVGLQVPDPEKHAAIPQTSRLPQFTFGRKSEKFSTPGIFPTPDIFSSSGVFPAASIARNQTLDHESNLRRTVKKTPTLHPTSVASPVVGINRHPELFQVEHQTSDPEKHPPFLQTSRLPFTFGPQPGMFPTQGIFPTPDIFSSSGVFPTASNARNQTLDHESTLRKPVQQAPTLHTTSVASPVVGISRHPELFSPQIKLQTSDPEEHCPFPQTSRLPLTFEPQPGMFPTPRIFPTPEISPCKGIFPAVSNPFLSQIRPISSLSTPHLTVVDCLTTISNMSKTQDNVSHISKKIVTDYSKKPHLSTPYLKKNPKRQNTKAQEERIHDVGQFSASLFGTVPSLPSLGTVSSAPICGTVPPAPPFATVPSTPPFGTIPPNDFISNFLHYNHIMQNIGISGPAANILSTLQVPPATPLSFSSSDLPTTTNNVLQQNPIVNLLKENPEVLKQINDLLTKSVLK